jgi:hypothetical protein
LFVFFLVPKSIDGAITYYEKMVEKGKIIGGFSA